MRFPLILILTFLPLMALSQNQTDLSVEDQIRIAILSDETVKIEELIANNSEAKAIIVKILPELIVMLDPNTLDLLSANGIPFDSKDDDGYSAVMRALQFGRTDNAKKLYALGASLEGISNDGYTVRLLAENVGLENFGPSHPSSFNLKMSEEEASQILLYAAEAGDLETVKFALDNGASVHAKANNGWTAAMLAGLGGHAVVLKTLILNDALQFNGIYHAADDVDLITAILVGEGGNAPKFWDNVEEMLHFVVEHKEVKKTSILKDRGIQYRAIAEKLDYPLFVLDIFPELYEPLPRIKSVIPTGIPATKENWKRVQGILLNNGLYEGSIDGDAGRGTMGALLAYYRPLVNNVKARSIEAAGSAYRDGSTAALKGPDIRAVCREKTVGTEGKKYSFCGEFKADRSSRIFTALFAGYTFLKVDNNRNFYGYLTGDDVFSSATKYISVLENYNLSKDTFYHTQIRAAVLDDVFFIEIHDKKIVYYLKSNSKKKYTIVGSFTRPKRPSGF